MADVKSDPGYAEHVEHPQDAHPDPWPGITGRSEEHENELPTGTKRESQASVTDAQRDLERKAPHADK